MQISKHPMNYIRFIFNVHKSNRLFPSAVNYYATTIDIDFITNDLVERNRSIQKQNITDLNIFSIRSFMDRTNSIKDVTYLSVGDIQKYVLELISKNRDNEIEQLLLDCHKIRKFIGEPTINKLFRHYSTSGRPDMIANLQKYCYKTNVNLYRRNGEFTHYVAKAECLRGNSEKGLSLLKECYQKYEGIRSFYRIIFRELIQDSVLNRSEASLVTFKKYVIDFSKTWNDHYPLICLWHLCWTSDWFSDQMMADELLGSSEALQDIVRDKAVTFSIMVLREDYNDDAVLRLLQALLKYDMMADYAKVLHVLFNFKLKNRDIRGCTEIIKNCKILGVSLPAYQQGRYIKMLIQEKMPTENKQQEKRIKNFKLKF